MMACASALCAMMCLTSCDDVKEGDRYILGEAITAERAVLLEDFTGQYCVNCPEAHEVIKQLEQQYGKDKVIAVSIHCGGFGLPVSATNFDRNIIGLMTEEGNTLCDSYGINAFPMGVIDNGQPQIYDLWPTTVRNELQVPTDVKIDLEAHYIPSPEDGENGYFGDIEIKADVLSGSARMANIQFWITEDNIVATQRSLTTTIPDYVHDNVFRGQIFGGVDGKQISLSAGISEEVTGGIGTRWTDKERWEINNLSVIAFVSDNTGVLQVTKVKLIPEEESDN